MVVQLKENINQILEYKRGERLRASTVNAIVDQLRQEHFNKYGADDIASHRRYDEEQNWIPFECAANIGLLYPYGLVHIVDLKRMSGDEGYLVANNNTGLWTTAKPLCHLVNGPGFCKGTTGSTGLGSFCFEGGWIAYDHTNGHPQPFEEWYFSGTKKLAKTVGGSASRRDIGFIALGGVRELYADYWIGRFVQPQPKLEAWFSAWRGQSGAMVEDYADGDSIILPDDSRNVNIRIKTTGTYANKRLEVAVAGKYSLHASMIARRADWSYYVTDAAVTISLGGYFLDDDETILEDDGAANTFLSGQNFVRTAGTLETEAVDSTRVIRDFLPGQGFMLRNDSGVTINVCKLSITMQRIGPYDLNSFYP